MRPKRHGAGDGGGCPTARGAGEGVVLGARGREHGRHTGVRKVEGQPIGLGGERGGAATAPEVEKMVTAVGGLLGGGEGELRGGAWKNLRNTR